MAVVEQRRSLPLRSLPRRGTWRRRLSQWFAALVFLAPTLVFLGIFHIYPLYRAGVISTHDWRRNVDRGFVGLDNYRYLFETRQVWDAFGNTVWYAAGTVPFQMLLAMVIAYLLFQKVRFLSFFRTAFFLPYVTSTVAAAAVWLWMFDPRNGLFNTVLGWVGIGPFRWVQEPRGIFELLAAYLHLGWWPGWAGGPSMALFSVMLVTIWHYLGFQIVVFLVGLTNVPNDLYEAARVDGASERQLFFRITLPMITPTILFVAVIATIGSFQSFNQIYQMTARANVGGPGGPLGTTETMVIKILNEFQASRYGDGAAMSMMLFAVILLLTLVQLWFSRRWVHY